MQMKDDKSMGTDTIPIEFEKAVTSPEYRLLWLDATNQALRTGLAPSEWKEVIISVLHKKDVRDDCNNYRGVSLMNHSRKVLEKMILNRLLPYILKVEGAFPACQCGFMPQRGTLDAIMVSRLLSSSAIARNTNLYKCFIDLSKAYDKVNRDILWEVLRIHGVPPGLTSLIKALHTDATAQVRLQGDCSLRLSWNVG